MKPFFGIILSVFLISIALAINASVEAANVVETTTTSFTFRYEVAPSEGVKVNESIFIKAFWTNHTNIETIKDGVRTEKIKNDGERPYTGSILIDYPADCGFSSVIEHNDSLPIGEYVFVPSVAGLYIIGSKDGYPIIVSRENAQPEYMIEWSSQNGSQRGYTIKRIAENESKPEYKIESTTILFWFCIVAVISTVISVLVMGVKVKRY